MSSAPTPSWLLNLRRDGYAVIPSLIDEKGCSELRDGFWRYWERISDGNIRQDTPESWTNIKDYYPNHGMLIQHWSIGHMQEIWNLRASKPVQNVFETIWNTSDLVVSFDGASTGLAPEVTGRGWHRKDWLHLDQSPQRSGFECVQGWVTANPVETGDGTLTLLKGSHLLHGSFAAHFGMKEDPQYRGDWLKLDDAQVDWYKNQGCEQLAVECPAGSMVLWDSRTVHAGRGPVKGRATARNRIVSYISMMPAALLKNGERRKKKIAVLEGRLTSHWAAQRVKLFGKYPRTYGKPLPPIPKYKIPLLTEDGARLAGWERPEECPLLIEDPQARKEAVVQALQALKPTKKRKKSQAQSMKK